jgi:hypothetical protein
MIFKLVRAESHRSHLTFERALVGFFSPPTTRSSATLSKISCSWRRQLLEARTSRLRGARVAAVAQQDEARAREKKKKKKVFFFLDFEAANGQTLNGAVGR